jgi:ABC-2 type transport system ATP-binding protein
VGMVADAARALQEAGIAANDLGLRRPTLDDVFLELTGEPVGETVEGDGIPEQEAVEPGRGG